MTEDTVQYLTQKKLEELELELKNIKEMRIPDLANRIDEAKQLGDLSENAEYHAARDEMAWTQSRAKEINYIIENSSIIEEDLKGGSVTIGSNLTVEINGKQKSYTLVGAQEADPIVGKISNESPLGAAFLGKKSGDRVTVVVPTGEQEYKVISVN
jgi:transcription elongation factor GreA